MKLGIVIVHYGIAQVTYDCIVSLLKNHGVGAVIVDCGGDRIEKSNNVFYTGNIGYGAACNFGFDKLRDMCEYVCMMNNDILFRKTTIPAILHHINIGNMGDLNCPCVMTPKNQIAYNGGRISLSGAIHDKSMSNFRAFRTDFIYGACVIANTKSFIRLGGYREEYFLYWEDVDLCIRAKAAGMTLKCLGDVFITHDEKRQTGIGRYYHTRNALLCHKLNYSWTTYFLYKIYFFSIFLPIRVIYFMFKRNIKAAKYCIIGAIDFFKGKTGQK